MKQLFIVLAFTLFTFNIFSQVENKVPSHRYIAKLIKSGDINKVKGFINDFNLDVNQFDIDKFEVPYLHKASSTGNIEIVKFLLGKHANTNVITKYGTAADWAAEKGHLDVISLLVKFGYNPKIEEMNYWVDKYNEQDTTIPEWFEKVVKKVIDSKVDYSNYPYTQYTDPSDNDILSASFLYLKAGKLSLMKALINKGANVNLINKYGYTPLFLAIRKCNIKAAKLLIKHGANVNIPLYSEMAFGMSGDSLYKNNITPLHYSLIQFEKDPESKKQLLAIIHLLKSNGADVTIRTTNENLSVTERANQIGDKELIKALRN